VGAAVQDHCPHAPGPPPCQLSTTAWRTIQGIMITPYTSPLVLYLHKVPYLQEVPYLHEVPLSPGSSLTSTKFPASRKFSISKKFRTSV